VNNDSEGVLGELNEAGATREDLRASHRRAAQRRLDQALFRMQAGPDERRLADAYLRGEVTLYPEAVAAPRTLGLLPKPDRGRET